MQYLPFYVAAYGLTKECHAPFNSQTLCGRSLWFWCHGMINQSYKVAITLFFLI